MAAPALLITAVWTPGSVAFVARMLFISRRSNRSVLKSRMPRSGSIRCVGDRTGETVAYLNNIVIRVLNHLKQVFQTDKNNRSGDIATATESMPAYDRSPSTTYREIDRWDDGVGWLAHPEEEGRRASHAVRGEDGVWVIDPVDTSGLDALLAEFGDVAGVAVLSDYHARDADVIATRHGVAVHVPRFLDRVPERIDAPIERVDGTLGESGIVIHRCRPVPGYQEAVAYRETDGTLYVPELLGTAPGYRVGTERVGVFLSHRLVPPRETLGELEPNRLLFGHGEGVFENPSTALQDALAGSRKRFPRAVVSHLGTNLRLVVSAFWN